FQQKSELSTAFSLMSRVFKKKKWLFLLEMAHYFKVSATLLTTVLTIEQREYSSLRRYKVSSRGKYVSYLNWIQ
ncbi:MAG: hypothetical protein J4F36_14165, partial [Nitrosopumilaceae archaeon]|nr:hypothetical protein [Nitrosopumilaceae archaeon]